MNESHNKEGPTYKKQKISLPIFAILIFAAGVTGWIVYYSRSLEAGSSDNLSGWAWSENIGWISFNCTNTGNCSSNYGVTADGSGNLSGWAWSENIGWISFHPADVAGCPSAPCAPKIDLSQNKLTGWAKALSANGNGWEGWIHLSGTASNGSPYGVSTPGCSYTGYAWGSDVVGWISFSNKNCDPDGEGTSNGGTGCPSAGTPIPSYGVSAAGSACGVPTLVVSPPSVPLQANAGTLVPWSVAVSGGLGPGSYTYLWNGDFPLNGKDSSPVYVIYSDIGTKTGQVTVSSGFQTKTSSAASIQIFAGILSFASNPSTPLNPGESATLSWATSDGFTSCTITDNDSSLADIGDVPLNCNPPACANPKDTVSPTRTTVFTLACTGPDGASDSRTLTINVKNIPEFIEISPSETAP